jgi:predicted DsbA family dithiol-disulfide isomerase
MDSQKSSFTLHTHRENLNLKSVSLVAEHTSIPVVFSVFLPSCRSGHRCLDAFVKWNSEYFAVVCNWRILNILAALRKAQNRIKESVPDSAKSGYQSNQGQRRNPSQRIAKKAWHLQNYKEPRAMVFYRYREDRSSQNGEKVIKCVKCCGQSRQIWI